MSSAPMELVVDAIRPNGIGNLDFDLIAAGVHQQNERRPGATGP